ncbi:MAG: lycopene cyclase domain-containing protein [Anaerolineae bacterium]|nr:lycopene cyclase domain-containing protein [Anaerolineae bacterium]
MTYFGYLVRFIATPLALIIGLTLYDVAYRKKSLPDRLRGLPARLVLVAHVLAALIYTTPWDNYLVATRVWWYDPQLVTGATIGWVPIEEYTFFVLQTLLTGLWLLWLARRLPPPIDAPFRSKLRWITTSITGLIWLAAVIGLLSGWKPGVYLTIQLAWALPPIIFQLAFGADILWRYRGLILLTLVPATLYLGATDAIAIGAGTWTIDPAQSLEIYLGGVLPLEEFTFFLVTNTLVAFGMTLVLARESQERTPSKLRSFIVQIANKPRKTK